VKREQRWLDDFFAPVATEILAANPSLESVVYSGDRFRSHAVTGPIIDPVTLRNAIDAAQATRPLPVMDGKTFTATARRKDGAVRVSLDYVNAPLRLPLYFWLSVTLSLALLLTYLRAHC